MSLEAFCHATEDVERVKQAMFTLIGFPNEVPLIEQKVEGSFGNDIILLKVTFEKQPEINAIVKNIRISLSKEDLEGFDVDSHVNDRDEFWMRFDKQEAYLGRIALGYTDTVQLKAKVAAFPAKRENAVELVSKEFFPG